MINKYDGYKKVGAFTQTTRLTTSPPPLCIKVFRLFITLGLFKLHQLKNPTRKGPAG